MARVLHSMQDWLPLSEQFVHTIVAQSRHRPVVVSRRKTQNRKTFPYTPVYSLGWFLPPPRPLTNFERRSITLMLISIATLHRVQLVHHHHGYRLKDVEGTVKNLRLPLVVSLYGQDVTTHVQKWPWDTLDTLPYARAVVVPSRFLAEQVTSIGVPAERIEIIPLGVDPDWFSPTPLPDGPPEVLFAGRFVEKKGIDVLLEAWPRVRKAVPDARLRLYGGGPLESRARRGGEGVVVEITEPHRRAEQMRDAIRRARVVVTPSRTAADGDAESQLIVNLEAQASARPVVTTRHGGIPEFVDEDGTALLVPEADSNELADAIVQVLADDGLAERLAAAGPAWARRFSVEACVGRLDDLYDRLMR